MSELSDLERLITLRIIQDDAESIVSLISNERDGIVSMETVPYFALFIQSCLDYCKIPVDQDAEISKIIDIRHHIKAYSDSFGKTKKEISSVNQQQDSLYKSDLKYDFLKLRNLYWNLGTFWTEDRHIVGNSQQIAAFLEVKSIRDIEAETKMLRFGYLIGKFISKVSTTLNIALPRPAEQKFTSPISISNCADFNTNRECPLFSDSSSKELNLFYLNLLCNMNFVKYILKPMLVAGNYWAFRVEYVVTYYTYKALKVLKKHCENNNDIKLKPDDLNDIQEFENIGNELFKSKLRNCMMHYGLVGRKTISEEYIDRPFYGIIESCFDDMNYKTYSESLSCFSDRLIAYLERHFDCENVKLKKD